MYLKEIRPNPGYQYMGVLREPIRKSYGPATIWPPIKVYRRKKKGNSGIIGNRNSVREEVNGPNRMDSYHEEIGDEDAMSYAREC